MWHGKTRKFAGENKLAVIGIAQEQHPDRTRLFMQWKEMDWPVLLDSLNLLGVKAVPLTFFLDESGTIRSRNPDPTELQTFVESTYPGRKDRDSSSWSLPRGSPDSAVLSPGPQDLGRAIQAWESRLRRDPQNAVAHFRLGVAYRKRFDSETRRPVDFGRAVASWKSALELQPDQYIWRRRIQQYGPRLDKPYSFYDWIHRARREIASRGEVPHPLTAEPSGAEFASPDPDDQSGEVRPQSHPDPDGDLPRDTGGLVEVDPVVVPSTQAGSSAFRVHLRFRPDPARKVHWDHAAGPLRVYPTKVHGLTLTGFQRSSPPPQSSSGTREQVVEFEVRAAAGKPFPDTFTVSAFYFVCEDVDGRCLFLRQEIPVRLEP